MKVLMHIEFIETLENTEKYRKLGKALLMM